MSELYALSAIGRDRPGIVAAITAELLDLQGNVEDSQMAILRGHFAVMLIVAVPDESPAASSRRGSTGCARSWSSRPSPSARSSRSEAGRRPATS